MNYIQKNALNIHRHRGTKHTHFYKTPKQTELNMLKRKVFSYILSCTFEMNNAQATVCPP